MAWGTLRGREDTGNVLGIGMASASLGSHAPARHARVPAWGPQLVSEAEAGSEHSLTVLKTN